MSHGMRVLPRFALASVAALGAALLVSFVAAVWLRTATPHADVVWQRSSVGHVTLWTLTSAHGVGVDVRAEAGLGDRLDRIADRIGGLFGWDIPTGVGASFSLLVAPLAILVVAGLVTGWGARRAGPRTARETLMGATASAAVHGCGLAALASVARTGIGTGIGGDILEAGISASVAPFAALFAGALWGGAFAFTGAVTAPEVRRELRSTARAVAAGWVHAVAIGCAGSALGLFVWALTRLGSGDGIANPSLVALGVLLLWPNAIMSTLTLAHGASMNLSLAVGPLAGLTRIDYLRPPSDSEAWWLFLLIPIAAGLIAGRTMRRHPDRSGSAVLHATLFGIAWGGTLTVIAILTRVRLASSLSVVRIVGGGGEAAIDPFAALLLGVVWGTGAALAGWHLWPPRETA